MSPIPFLKCDDDTDQRIVDDESEDPGEYTISSEIEEEDLDDLQEVPLLG